MKFLSTSPFSVYACCATLLLPSVLALRQPYEYLETLRNFQDEFLNPAPVAKTINASIFSPDIVGRVDVTTTFTGQELNTEYIFALFMGFSGSVNTTVLGVPVNQTIQSLVVEPPITYVSTVTNLLYESINFILPVQIDMIIRWDDNLKMTSYDAAFRRWSEAFDYLVPKIAPQIAKEFDMPYVAGTTNDTALIALRAATDTCDYAIKYCVGDNLQYQTHDDCMTFLTQTVPFGPAYAGGLDTGFCRYIHRNMLPYRPEVHCPHVGPSGGDMCIARDYIDIVTGYPFLETLVAYNATVHDEETGHLSIESQEALLHTDLELVYPSTVVFFSVPTICLFVFLYMGAKLIEALLRYYFKTQMKEMSLTNQRNTVTYVLNAFVTTIALAFQLVATPTLAERYTYTSIACLKVTAILVAVLYVFELTYRPSMRFSLLLHHYCTLVAIISLFVSLENSNHPATIGLGLIWLFQATTEQSIFIGLLGYRLKFSRSKVRVLLRFAAVQSFFVKFVFAVYLLVWWGMKLEKYHTTKTDIYFSVIVVVIGTLLLLTQIYGSYAVWSIASNMKKEDQADIPLSNRALSTGSTNTPAIDFTSVYRKESKGDLQDVTVETQPYSRTASSIYEDGVDALEVFTPVLTHFQTPSEQEVDGKRPTTATTTSTLTTLNETSRAVTPNSVRSDVALIPPETIAEEEETFTLAAEGGEEPSEADDATVLDDGEKGSEVVQEEKAKTQDLAETEGDEEVKKSEESVDGGESAAPRVEDGENEIGVAVSKDTDNVDE